MIFEEFKEMANCTDTQYNAFDISPLSKKLRERYEGYYRAMLREESEN